MIEAVYSDKMRKDISTGTWFTMFSTELMQIRDCMVSSESGQISDCQQGEAKEG